MNECKQHPDYSDLTISDRGYVFKTQTGFEYKNRLDKNGSAYIVFDTKKLLVAKLVLETFKGHKTNGRVGYKNGDKSDCSLENLEWAISAADQSSEITRLETIIESQREHIEELQAYRDSQENHITKLEDELHFLRAATRAREEAPPRRENLHAPTLASSAEQPTPRRRVDLTTYDPDHDNYFVNRAGEIVSDARTAKGIPPPEIMQELTHWENVVSNTNYHEIMKRLKPRDGSAFNNLSDCLNAPD